MPCIEREARWQGAEGLDPTRSQQVERVSPLRSARNGRLGAVFGWRLTRQKGYETECGWCASHYKGVEGSREFYDRSRFHKS